MSVFKLGLALIFVSCIVVSCLELDDDSTRGLIIRQFLDKYQPALLVHPTMRRFRRFNYVGNFDIEPEENSRMKRNNAEVVNHILKNYGGLERLGDVGR